jgi:hypothetical protein
VSGHTPGPWTAEREVGVGIMIQPIGVAVGDHYEEYRADAALIAAAPDLLAASRKALGPLREIYPTVAGDAITALEAAVARAEGAPSRLHICRIRGCQEDADGADSCCRHHQPGGVYGDFAK